MKCGGIYIALEAVNPRGRLWFSLRVLPDYCRFMEAVDSCKKEKCMLDFRELEDIFHTQFSVLDHES